MPKNSYNWVLALLMLLSGSALYSQSGNNFAEDFQTGMLHGKNHVYSLTAPKGWVLDNEAWAEAGIHAVFYPRGSSASGKKVAYTRFFAPHPKGVAARADEDLADFLRENPRATSANHAPMKTRFGLNVAIRSVHGDNRGNDEWLAYVEAPTGVIFIAMVAKDPKDFEALRQPFNELVTSCSWITDLVLHDNLKK
jgi:hypothetical protein